MPLLQRLGKQKFIRQAVPEHTQEHGNTQAYTGTTSTQTHTHTRTHTSHTHTGTHIRSIHTDENRHTQTYISTHRHTREC